MSKLSPPDVLINNAGFSFSGKSLFETVREDFDGVTDINVKGLANTTRHFVPSMIALNRGVIANMTSWDGPHNELKFGAYTTSKWALEV